MAGWIVEPTIKPKQSIKITKELDPPKKTTTETTKSYAQRLLESPAFSDESKKAVVNSNYIDTSNIKPSSPTTPSITNGSVGATNPNVESLLGSFNTRYDLDNLGTFKNAMGYKSNDELVSMYKDYVNEQRAQAASAQEQATNDVVSAIIDQARMNERTRQNEMAAASIAGGGSPAMFMASMNAGNNTASGINQALNGYNDAIADIYNNTDTSDAAAMLNAYRQYVSDNATLTPVMAEYYTADVQRYAAELAALAAQAEAARYTQTAQAGNGVALAPEELAARGYDPNEYTATIDADGNLQLRYTQTGLNNAITSVLGKKNLENTARIDANLPDVWNRAHKLYQDGELEDLQSVVDYITKQSHYPYQIDVKTGKPKWDLDRFNPGSWLEASALRYDWDNDKGW